MAGLLGTGAAYQDAYQKIGEAQSQHELQRNEEDKMAKAAHQQQVAGLAGTGAAVGFAAGSSTAVSGAAAGSWGGPIGALVGAGLGFLIGGLS